MQHYVALRSRCARFVSNTNTHSNAYAISPSLKTTAQKPIFATWNKSDTISVTFCQLSGRETSSSIRHDKKDTIPYFFRSFLPFLYLIVSDVHTMNNYTILQTECNYSDIFFSSIHSIDCLFRSFALSFALSCLLIFHLCRFFVSLVLSSLLLFRLILSSKRWYKNKEITWNSDAKINFQTKICVGCLLLTLRRWFSALFCFNSLLTSTFWVSFSFTFFNGLWFVSPWSVGCVGKWTLFYDRFECYLMSFIQCTCDACDRLAQFSTLN